jgi:hypothetical protein
MVIFGRMRYAFLFLLFTSTALLVHAQSQNDEPIRSENGWYLSPHGTIRILVLFVEIEYDVKPEKDPQRGGVDHWKQGELPRWKDDVFDPHPMPVYEARVSRYFQDISLGRYTVLGDYMNELLTLKESEYPGVHNAHSIGRLAVEEANKRPALITRHGLDITDFDLWKDGGKAGRTKEKGPDDPHRYDHVMVIIRNSGLGHGAGSTDPGSPGKLFGYESDTQSRFGAMYALPFEILKHEYNHLLLGGNNFHSGGGNAARFESNFMTLQGGWSMMGAAGSSLLTCSAWDRDRLGWAPDGVVHRIRARDPNGREVNGDLDPANGDTGIFVLRDFVPSGDALRIRMPRIPEEGQQQWLWVENHQGFHVNGSPTDLFHWESSADCIAPIEPGLFMQMQIGREEREGPMTYRGRADYLRPVLANGFYDFRLRGDTLHDMCPFKNNSTPFFMDADLANPLTGNHEQELPLIDRNGDAALEHGEHWVPGTRLERGKPDTHVVFAGKPDHAFRTNGVRKIGMCTNPSSTNMLTLISTNDRDVFQRGSPNVRTAYLNGISVELLAMENGNATVRIRNDDTRMVTDQRWCADSIVLPPLRGKDGHSLTIATGATLRVDRSRTPTRMTEPEVEKGISWFSDPTTFTVLSGAHIEVEAGARVELVEGSTLHLLPGSVLNMDKQAELRVEPGSRIIVHPTATLQGKACSLKKLRKKGRVIELAP